MTNHDSFKSTRVILRDSSGCKILVLFSMAVSDITVNHPMIGFWTMTVKSSIIATIIQD